VNEAIAELVLARTRTSVLHQAALDAGMHPMLREGLLRAWEGVTTLEELLWVLPAQDRERGDGTTS
jgi:type II secretory ATPase GspE/PulE/Tfp pilus assembly ATPase PilB-like protein